MCPDGGVEWFHDRASWTSKGEIRFGERVEGVESPPRGDSTIRCRLASVAPRKEIPIRPIRNSGKPWLGKSGFMKRARAIAMKSAIVLASVLFSITCLEVLLRIYNPIESRVRGDRIVLPIQKTYVSKNETISGLDQAITHTKNSLGFRGPEPPLDGEPTFSIITVGGSTTECSLITDGKTWTDVFASHFNESADNIWVNNAGLDGHSTFGHAVLAKDILLSIRPDLLVFLFGANDVGLKRPGEHTASQLKGPVRLDSVEGFLKSLAYRSETVNLGINGMRIIRAKARGLDHTPIDLRSLDQLDNTEEYTEEVLNRHRKTFIPLFETRVNDLVSVCIDNDIEVVLMTQPALYGEGVDKTTGVDLARIEALPTLNGETAWGILELYNETTRKIANDRQLLLVDLAHELPKDSRFFYDFLHYTNAGAREVGRIVAVRLESHILGRLDELSLDNNEHEDTPLHETCGEHRAINSGLNP